MKDLFAAFEEKDLQTLKLLNESVRMFDPMINLKKTETKDRSSRHLCEITQAYSIKKFDRRTLRKVESFDKSDPIYIYTLSVSNNSSIPHEDDQVNFSNEQVNSTFDIVKADTAIENICQSNDDQDTSNSSCEYVINRQNTVEQVIPINSLKSKDFYNPSLMQDNDLLHNNYEDT